MAARRQRTSDRGVKDFDALVTAVKAIKIAKQHLRPVATRYGIPKSSLGRYISKFDEQVEDITVLDDDQIKNVLRKIAAFQTHQQV